MTFRILDVELTDGDAARAPLPEHAAALILRYRGYPVGFQLCEQTTHGWSAEMRALQDPDTVRRLVARAASAELKPCPATHERPSVSIAICTRDRPAYVERCLESLQQLDPGPEHETSDFEIVVVDNAPTDERTYDVAARHPGVRYLHEPLAGLNFARNAALEQAKGELLVYLDDDVVVDRGWLGALVAAWRDQPDAGFFTGQVLPLELATPAQAVFERRGGFRRGFDREYFGPDRDNDRNYPCGAGVFGTGANMTLNRQAALALGGFDVALDAGRPLPGGGDLDMFYRLIRAGYNAVYEPGYLVFHQHRREMTELRRQYRDSWGKALIAFSVKSWRADPAMRSRWRSLLIWWFGKQVTDVIRSLSGRTTRPVSMIVAELQGGLIGLFGEYGRSRRRVRRVARSRA